MVCCMAFSAISGGTWHYAGAARRVPHMTTCDLRGHGYSDVRQPATTATLAHDLKSCARRPGHRSQSRRTRLWRRHLSHFAALSGSGVRSSPSKRARSCAPAQDHEWEGWRYWVSLENWADGSARQAHRLDFLHAEPGNAEVLRRRAACRAATAKPISLIPTRPCSVTTKSPANARRHSAHHHADAADAASLALPRLLRTPAAAFANATPVCRGEHFGPLEQPELLVQQIRAFCGVHHPGPPYVPTESLGHGSLMRPIESSLPGVGPRSVPAEGGS